MRWMWRFSSSFGGSSTWVVDRSGFIVCFIFERIGYELERVLSRVDWLSVKGYVEDPNQV